MSELNANKECILDYFGKCVIEEVYDRALYGAKRTLELTTKNPIVLEKYSIFSELTQEQKKKLYEQLIREESITQSAVYQLISLYSST